MGQVTRIQSLHFMDKTGQAHTVDVKLRSAAILSGRVVDLEGRGVGGVELLGVDPAAYRDVANGRATSGPDGAFSFTTLPPGKYQITTASAAHVPAVRKDVQTPIEDLEFILTSLPAVRGRVLDGASGAGVPNFALQLLSHQGGADGPAIPVGEPLVVSGSADGSFIYPLAAKPGSWSMQASAVGYAPTVSEPFSPMSSAGVSDVLVSMKRGGNIRGRLVNESAEPIVGGRVTTRDNAWTDDPMSQMLGDEEGHTATRRLARSDKNGQFILENLRPADYQLILRAARYAQGSVRDLAVVEGESIDLGDVVLSAGGGLHGVLVDSQDSPVVGGMVFLSPEGGQKIGAVRRAKSGIDGRWKITDIIPASYLLTGKPPAKRDAGAFGLWPAPGGQQLVIQAGVEDMRMVRLDDWTLPAPEPMKLPTGNLSGTALSAAGEGIEGMGLQLVPVGGGDARESKTSSGGSFSFVSLPPGEYDLLITGEPNSSVRVTILADAWTNQNLQSER